MSEGNGTRRKEQLLRACMRQSLTISMCDRSRLYTHIDLTAGRGVNEKAGCLGSPIEFAKLAIGFNRPVRLICCDRAERCALTLRGELSRIVWPSDWPAWVLYCDDNADVLRRLHASLDQEPRPFGSLICDPNGPAQGYPHQELMAFASRYAQMDLILTFNVNLFRSIDPARLKRDCATAPAKGLATCYQRYGSVRSNIKSFARKQWWVSNQTNYGGPGHSFIVAVGRNKDVEERPCDGFYRLDKEGAEIIDNLSSYRGQHMLPFPSRGGS